MTDISLNGSPTQVDHGSLRELVADVTGRSVDDVSSGAFAVARNSVVVPRGTWHTVPIEPGDEIEIVTALQGG